MQGAAIGDAVAANHVLVSFAEGSNKEPNSTGRFYVPELDALRFFAFLAVFVFHVHPRAELWRQYGLVGFLGVSGGFGVDLFFVLSAYLITKLLVREREITGRVDVKSFYIRRTLRIWPLYFSFLALLLLLVWSGFAGSFAPLPGPVYFLAFFGFVGNFVVPFITPNLVLNPLWSISVEEQFYLAWPLVARGTTRSGQVTFALCLMAGAVGVRLLLSAAGYNGYQIWHLTFTRLDAIAWGIILAALPEQLLSGLGLWKRLGLASIGAWCWLFAGFCDPIWPTASVAKISLGYPAAAIGSAAFVAAALGASRHGARFMSNRTLVYLGKISYGLYVFHGMAIKLSQAFTFRVIRRCFMRYGWPPPWLGFSLYIVMSLSLTIVLAVASYHLLETPFLKLKRRFTYVPSRPA